MIRLIAAIDRKQGIAKHGFQPWSIPADEQYFADQTKSQGAEILMGSTTFKVIGAALPDRQNYVLSHDKTPLEGATVINDLHAFLTSYTDKDLWVIGGANVYSQVIETGLADELYLTEIEADFGCDQFFPKFDPEYTVEQQSELHEQNGFIFRYKVYAKS